MPKRRKRKRESTGALATFFEIVLGAAGGAAIAAIWLILKPVSMVDSPRRNADEEPVRHAVNYHRGQMGLVRESQVRQKEAVVLQQSEPEVSLSEQEINRWFATRYGAASARDLFGSGIEMRTEPPAVRLVEDKMQIGLVYSFAGYGTKKSIVLQSIGRLDRRGSGGLEFVPQRTYLGSCPLPTGFLSRWAVNSFLSSFEFPAEIQQAWREIRDVTLADRRVNLRFGGVTAGPESEPAPAAVVTPENEATAQEASAGGAAAAPLFDEEPGEDSADAAKSELESADAPAEATSAPEASAPSESEVAGEKPNAADSEAEMAPRSEVPTPAPVVKAATETAKDAGTEPFAHETIADGAEDEERAEAGTLEAAETAPEAATETAPGT